MSQTKKWLLLGAAVLAFAVASPIAEAGPIRFAGRVAVRAPVAAVRTAAVVSPPYYRPYYAPVYRPYYAPAYRTYYTPGYTYGTYYVRPYTVARPVIYVR